MSRPPIADELKVKFLERLVKNLYHGKSVEWGVHSNEDWDGDPNHLWGWVRIDDLNDPTEVPKLFDCCDNGLSQDIGSEAVPDEYHIIKELSPYRVKHHVDIYFDRSDYQEIESLKARIAEAHSLLSELSEEEFWKLDKHNEKCDAWTKKQQEWLKKESVKNE